MSDLEALARARFSVRAFHPDPVPRAVVERLLRVARLAPSGGNLQPGRFLALSGEPLARLVAALEVAVSAGRPQVREFVYYPDPMPPHLKDRQREAGYALYEALGIDRRDHAARAAQFRHNYRFFGAPVGIVVTIERVMGPAGFMDLGMALQTLMLAAVEAGLATCGIGALSYHADVVRDCLGLPETELVVCGLALGHAEDEAPLNRFRTNRLPLEGFAEFRGFGD